MLKKYLGVDNTQLDVVYNHIPFVASSFACYCCFTQLSFFFGSDYVFIWNVLVGYATNLEDFLGSLILLLVNSTISFLEENNVANVATTFMAHLTHKTKVC
jgi:hypothetical protein